MPVYHYVNLLIVTDDTFAKRHRSRCDPACAHQDNHHCMDVAGGHTAAELQVARNAVPHYSLTRLITKYEDHFFADPVSNSYTYVLH